MSASHLALPAQQLSTPTDDGAKGIVEMLFCTSLIALVGAADQPQSSPRKLQIVNTKVRLGCSSPALPAYAVAETIHDMRVAFSLVHSRRQDEQENPCHRARNRNIHLRHLQHATAARH